MNDYKKSNLHKKIPYNLDRNEAEQFIESLAKDKDNLLTEKKQIEAGEILLNYYITIAS